MIYIHTKVGTYDFTDTYVSKFIHYRYISVCLYIDISMHASDTSHIFADTLVIHVKIPELYLPKSCVKPIKKRELIV